MIKEIRQELGLSQEMVAGYLRISRSHLAMVESKRRELNSPAFTQLLTLYSRFISKENKKPTKVSPGVEKAIQKNILQTIDRHINQKEYALSTASKRLKKLEAQNKQAADMLGQLASLKAGTTGKDKLIVEMIESNAQKLLIDASADNRLKLQVKIQGLSAEIKFLSDRKAKLKI